MSTKRVSTKKVVRTHDRFTAERIYQRLFVGSDDEVRLATNIYGASRSYPSSQDRIVDAIVDVLSKGR